MRIGFIGSGNIGGTLARLLAGAGHDVVLANSRGPESLATNYFEPRDGTFPALAGGTTTPSELLASALPGATVVKAFNTIHFRHLVDHARPPGDPQRRAIPIAGDDAGAKATVGTLMDQIGFDAYDAGPLAQGRRFDPGTPLFNVALNGREVAAALG